MTSLRYFTHPLATVAPRDLLLQRCLGATRSDTVLEVGTGSGSSLFRFAGSVAAYHGIDISSGPIERLRQALARHPQAFNDVKLFTLDFCKPAAADDLPCRYNVVLSCDTLEHVQEPGPFLKNVFASLKPGGRAFITYPNEHPRHAHGITYFERRADVLRVLTAAGFSADEIDIATLTMATPAKWVHAIGWCWPQMLAKVIKQLVVGKSPNSAPQTFDETDFFALANRLEPLAPAINAYCWLVLKAMGATGPAYRVSPSPETIWDTRILIRAVRSKTEPSGSEGRDPVQSRSPNQLLDTLAT